MGTSFILAPSLLSADFSRLAEELTFIEANGGEWVHLDVMDGAFVPNLTFGAPVVRCLRNKSTLPFDVHLMVERPQDFVKTFAEAGADYFTFHIEASVHAHRLISEIRAAGMKPGVSIVPSTPVHILDEVLPLVDLVLVMTVNPGFGGQTMISGCLEKVRELRKRRTEKQYTYLISVDGGINAATITNAADAGADVIVSGSSFFSGDIKK
ncbi:MAG: ribulose-phosphate 3-epimerase [Treponema sp.]|uniref:ribulose-phosphate 3-epimerase n=1 Tax=Treponema sp. TaxID=166 RepID=UPI003FA2876B